MRDVARQTSALVLASTFCFFLGYALDVEDDPCRGRKIHRVPFDANSTCLSLDSGTVRAHDFESCPNECDRKLHRQHVDGARGRRLFHDDLVHGIENAVMEIVDGMTTRDCQEVVLHACSSIECVTKKPFCRIGATTWMYGAARIGHNESLWTMQDPSLETFAYAPFVKEHASCPPKTDWTSLKTGITFQTTYDDSSIRTVECTLTDAAWEGLFALYNRTAPFISDALTL